MNTRFIETFVLLARVGSVRRVAEQMHATPGAISMRVRALEQVLGVTLFDWDRKTLQITADGARLLRHAEAVVEATSQLERAAQSRQLGGVRVRLGIIETVVHTWLPDFMKAMGSAAPELELDLTVDLSVQLGDQLMRRDMDVILRVPGDTDNPFVTSESLMELPVHWIARRGLVPQRDGLRKTLGKQLLTQMRGSQPYEAAVALARELAAQQGMGASELRITGSPSLAALVSMVREGVGVAIMPGVLVKDHLERGELVELPLPVPEPFRVAVCYPKNVLPSVTRVVECARRVIRLYCRRLGEHWVRPVG